MIEQVLLQLKMNRQTFIKKGLTAGGMLLMAPAIIARQSETFSEEEIYEFVAAAHKDLDAVIRIFDRKPLILNCANQIVRGDFETAMGGASHMGRKDIVDFLRSKGARMDIFSYTFLGYTDFVQKQIEAFPMLLKSPGPHGFTLLHHAKVGEQESLVDWFQEKGLKETMFKGSFG